jgi:hypothetical protein
LLHGLGLTVCRLEPEVLSELPLECASASVHCRQ